MAVDPQLAALFGTSPVSVFIGQQLVECEGGVAEVVLPHRPEFQQALGVTHGGIIATIADTAGFFAAASSSEATVATVEFKINLLAAARGETLRARGTVVQRGSRLVIAEMKVTSDSGTLIAIGLGTYARLSAPRP